MGVEQTYVPLCQIFWSLGSAAMVYPIGVMADKYGVQRTLTGVFCLMMIGNICLSISSIPILFFGMSLWGAQTYAAQSLLAAEINFEVPENLRGTAFGILYLACGVCLVIASTWAGYVWEHFGHSVMFSIGAAIGLLSIFLAKIYFPRSSVPRGDA